MSKIILLLFIPSLILIIPYIRLLFSTKVYHGWYISTAIILIIGDLSLLCYYLLNKTLIIKIYYKTILAIILPVSCFIGYWSSWIIIMISYLQMGYTKIGY
jgi:hypothetical protein